jgi:hypothetical protein
MSSQRAVATIDYKLRPQRDAATIAYFEERSLAPGRVAHRYDGTVELTWHVDDCDERYVRVMSSTRGSDHVLVSRDRRVVDAVVLAGAGEIFEWVKAHLEVLSKSSLESRRGAGLAGVGA